MHNLSLASPRYRQSNLSPDIKKKGCWLLSRGSQTQTCTSHQNENQNHCIHLIIGPSLLFAAASPFPHQGLSFMSVGRPNIGEQRLGQQRTCLYFIVVLLSSLYYTCYSLPTQPAALTDAHIFVPPTQKTSPRMNYLSPF